MDEQGFYEGIKAERAKNEELVDGAQFFVGLKKQAYYGDIACSPPGSSSPAKGWIGLFEGSPLMQQALALERQELTMEAEDIAKRQQDRAESDGRMRMDQQRWDLRDQIRIKKRELELQLAEQQMGGAGEQPEMQAGAAPSESALPKPEAGVAQDVAPATGEMPKLATRKVLVLKKLAYEIQPSDRPEIPKGQFAQPNKEEAGHKGKYPIPDRQHARSALGFAKMHGDTGALAAVKQKIRQKYPDMLEHTAGMTNSEVAPASGGANPPATVPGTGMPKMAGVVPYPIKDYAKHVLEGTAKGGIQGMIGGGLGGAVGGAINAKKVPKGQKLKAVGQGAARGAVLGAGVAGAAHGAKRLLDVGRNARGIRQINKTLGMSDAELLKTAGAADVIGKVLQYKHTPAIAGGLVGGAYMLHRSKGRQDLKGKSKDEVEAEQNVKAMKEDPPQDPGFAGKLSRQVTESTPGFAKVLREHPAKAALLGAGFGAQAGKGLAEVIGRGADRLRQLAQARQQLQLPMI